MSTASGNATVIGHVTEAAGPVIVVNQDGEQRILETGDAVYLNEQIITQAAASASIQLMDNRVVSLREQSSLLLDDSFRSSLVLDIEEDKSGSTEIEDVQEEQKTISEIVQGADPVDVAPASAAGDNPDQAPSDESPETDSESEFERSSSPEMPLIEREEGTISVSDEETYESPVFVMPEEEERVSSFGAANNYIPVALSSRIFGSEDGNILEGHLHAMDGNSGETLTFHLVSEPQKGSISLSENGFLKFEPGTDFQSLAEGDQASVSFTFEVRDARGSFSQASVDIKITGVNDTPEVEQSVESSTDQNSGQLTVNLLEHASDVDAGDDLYVSRIQLQSGDESGISLSLTGNELVIDPQAYKYLAEGEQEALTYEYRVTDSQGAYVIQTAEIVISGQNDLPTVSNAVVYQGDQNAGSLSVNLLDGASDIDLSDTLSVVSLQLEAGDPQGITFDSQTSTLEVDSSAYAELAEGEIETVEYSYQVDDGQDGQVAQTATLEIEGINDAPVSQDHQATINEDTPYIFALADFPYSDIDNNDQLEYVQISTLPTEGLIFLNGQPVLAGQDISRVDIENGLLIFTPEDNASGDDYSSFNFRVSDGDLLSTEQTFSFDVVPVADEPELSIAGSEVISELDFESSLEDWTTKNSPEIQSNGGPVGDAHSGSKFAELDAGSGGTPDAYYYDVDTSQGHDHELVLWIKERGGSDHTDDVEIVWNGDVIASIDPTTTWGEYRIQLPNTGEASSQVVIRELSSQNQGSGPLLDDISVIRLGAEADTDPDIDYTISSLEDTLVPIDVEALLEDSDGSESLTLTLSGAPAGATITDGSNTLIADGSDIDLSGFQLNTLSLIPVENSTADFDLTITATATESANNEQASDSKVLHVDLVEVNDAPETTNASATVDEDTPYIFAASDFIFTDVDTGDEFEGIQITQLPAAGTLLFNGSVATIGQDVSKLDLLAGRLKFEPALNENGNQYASFEFKVNDGELFSEAASFEINVTPVNDAPVVSADINETIDEDISLTLTEAELLANASDIDGDTLSVNNVRTSSGQVSVIDNGDSTWTITPDENWSGSAELLFDVTDGAVTVSSQIKLAVDPVADEPIITLDDSHIGIVTPEISATEDTDFSLDLGATLTDSDGSETLNISLAGIPSGFVITDGSSTETSDGSDIDVTGWNLGNLTFSPAANYNTDFTIAVTATSTESVGGDTSSITRNISVQMQAVNDAAIIDGDDTGVVTEDAAGTLDVSGALTVSDVDDGEGLFTAETVTGNYGDLSISAGGNWSYQADNSQSDIQSLGDGDTVTDSLSIRSIDGTVHNIVITISGTNDAVQITGATSATITEDIAVTAGDQLLASGQLNVTDVDNGEAFFSPGSVSGNYGNLNIDSGGNWIYTTDNTQSSIQSLGDGDQLVETLTVTTLDGSSQNISITINGSNDTAEISGVNAGDVTEDAAAQLTTSGVLNITDTDAGEDEFNAETQSGVYGDISIDEAGNWSYSADNSQTAIQELDDGETLTDSFTITSADGTSETIDITLHGENDAPVVVNEINDQTVAEEQAFSFQVPAETFADIDGDNLTYSAIQSNGSPLPDWLSFDPVTRTFSGTPDDPDIGILDIRVMANDGTTATAAEFSLDVTPVNDPPELQPGSFSIEENSGNGSVLGMVATNDVDSPSLTYSLTDDANGRFVINSSTGEITVADSSGLNYEADTEHSITVQVSDGQYTDTQNYTVSVLNKAEAPVISSDVEETGTDDSGVMSIDLLENATAVEIGETLSVNSLSLIEGDDTGVNFNGTTMSVDASQYAYLPDGVSETIQYSYNVVGSGGESSPQTVTITITGNNEAAQITGIDTASLAEDSASQLTATGNLDINDEDTGEDFFTPATHNGTYGSLTIDNSGNWDYSADNSQSAIQQLGDGDSVSDAITVSAVDGTTHQIEITITGANDAAIISGASTASLTEDSANASDELVATGALTISDTNLDEEFFVATDLTGLHGTLNLDEDGNWNYTADNNQAAIQELKAGETLEDGFTITSADGTTHQIVITINGTNDAPLLSAAPADQTIAEEDLFSYQIPANAFTDIEGEALTYSATLQNGDPLPAWLSFNPTTRTFSGTPDDADLGEINIQITASDGTGSTTADFSLTVTSVNDTPVVSASISKSTNEDTSLTLTNAQLVENTSDIDGDALAAGNLQVVSGNVSVTDNGNGTWTITPASNWSGTAEISFDISDGVETVTSTLNLNVDAVADLPITIVNDGNNENYFVESTEDTPIPLNISIALADTDGSETLDVEMGLIPVGATVSDGVNTVVSDGSNFSIMGWDWANMVLTSPPNQEEDFSVYIFPTATETSNSSAAPYPYHIRIDIQPENDAAVIGGVNTGTVTEDDFSSYGPLGEQELITDGTLTISDIDSEAEFVAETITGSHGELTINTSGQWEYIADSRDSDIQELGVIESLDDVITVRSADGTTHDITVTIQGANDQGQGAPVYLGTLAEDNSLIINESSILNAVTDIDGDTLTVSTINLPVGGHTIVNNNNGTWTLTPAENFNGMLEMLYVVSDGTQGYEVNNLVRVNITAVADTAVISGDDSGAVTEDAAATLTTSGQLDVTDPDAGEAGFIAETVNGTYGSLTIDAAGSWTYSADNSQSSIQALKDGETVSDDISVFSIDGTTETITITINGTSDAAVIGGVISGAVTEDSSAILSTNGTLTINDPDANEAGFIADSFTGSYGSLTIDANGSWNYSADNTQAAIQALGDGDNLSDTLTVQSQDGTTHNIVVTITGTDDAPIATAVDLGNVDEDNNLVITEAQLLANASDVDGDALSVSNLSLDNSSHGSLADNGDSTWTFSPSDDFNGSGISFNFTVSDGSSGDEATASATLDINAINDAPTAETPISSDYDLPVGMQIGFDATDALSKTALQSAGWGFYENDEIRENDILEKTLSQVDTQTSDDNMKYISLDGDSSDAEAFLIQDSMSDAAYNLPNMYYNFTADQISAFKESGFKIAMTVMSSGEVDISLGEASSSNQHYGFTEGIPDDNQFHDIVIEGHLTADNALVIDSFTVDDNAASYTTVATDHRPSQFDDLALSLGAYSSPYTSADHSLLLKTINIEALPRAFETIEDQSFDFTVPASAFDDVDSGDVLTYSLKTGAPDWLSINATTGQITGTPENDDVGTHTITVIASDSSNASAESSFTLNVVNSADAAVISGDDTDAVSEDTSATLTASGTLSVIDPDAGESGFTAETVNGSYGSLTIDAAGNWTYSADNSQAAIQSLEDGASATDSITVSSLDGTTHQVNITINGTNDVPTIDNVTSSTLTEESVSAGDVVANFSATDVDAGNTLTYSLTEGNDDGYFAINSSTGQVTLTQAGVDAINRDTGADINSIVLKAVASDGTASTGDMTASVSIDRVNDNAPVITGITTESVQEDGSDVTFSGASATHWANSNRTPDNLIDGDDAEGDSWSFPGSDIGHEPSATLVLDGSQTLTTLNLNFELDSYGDPYRPDQIKVEYKENGGWVEHGTFNTTSSEVNTLDFAPVNTSEIRLTMIGNSQSPNGAVAINQITAQSFGATGQLAASDLDDTDTPSFTVLTNEQGVYGVLNLGADGHWTYSLDNSLAQTLKADEEYTETFTVTATDGNGESTTQSLTVTVNGQNDAPIISSAIDKTTNEDTNFTITEAELLANASDVEGEALSASNVTVVSGSVSVVDNGNGTWTVSPDGNWSGTGQLAFDVSDGRATSSGLANITVTPDADAPVITPTSSEAITLMDFESDALAAGWTSTNTVEIDRASVYGVTDSSGGDGYVMEMDAGVESSADAIQYTIDTSTGFDHELVFTHRARPGNEHTDTVEVVWNGEIIQTIDPGNSWTNITITLPADGADSGTLELRELSSENNGGGALIDNLSISSVNSITFDEDSSASFEVTAALTDTDASESITSVSVAGVPSDFVLGDGVNSITSDGSDIDISGWDISQLTLTPSSNTNGSVSVTISATTTESGSGDTATTLQAIELNIQSVADTAIISGDDTGTVQEDAAATITASGTLSVIDPDAGEAFFVAETISGTYGSVIIDVAGNWSYSADNTQNAIQSLDDGESVTDVFSVSSLDGTTHNVVITINGQNDIASSTDQLITFDEDTTYIFSTNDFSFSDIDSSDSLQSITITQLPGSGELQLNGALVSANDTIAAADIENLTFAPVANANGSSYANLQFTVSDGTANSTAQTLTFDVTAINDPPTAPAPEIDQFDFTWGGDSMDNKIADTYSLPSDFSLGDSVWVHQSDDVYRKAVQVEVSDNGEGTLNFKVIGAAYTTLSNWNSLNAAQQETFFKDGNGTSQLVATSNSESGYGISDIAIHGGTPVSGFPDPVSGVDIHPFFVAENGLGNAVIGTVSSTDLEGDALTFSLSNDAGGRFAINSSTGEITVSDSSLLDFEAAGTHTVTVEVSDGSLTSSRDYSIYIQDTNDAPELLSPLDNQTTAEEAAFSYTLPASAFSDQDGDAIIFSASLANDDPLPVWLNFDPATRTFSGTPDDPDIGSISVKITLSDGVASTDVFWSVDVTAVNDAPIASDDSNSGEATAEGLTITGSSSVLVNDTDVENDPLTVVDINGTTVSGSTIIAGDFGDLTIGTDGNWTYTPGSIDLQTDLVGHWTLDGNTLDSAAADTIADDGSLLGGATTSGGGINGSSLNLTSEGDGLLIGASVEMDDLAFASRTVSFAFRIDESNSLNSRQMLFEEGGVTQGLNAYIDNGKLYIGGYDNSIGWDGTWYSVDLPSDNDFHSLALTLGSNELTAYLDGNTLTTVVSDVHTGTKEMSSTHQELSFGARYSEAVYHDSAYDDPGASTAQTFIGELDEIRVFNRTLNQQEVAALDYEFKSVTLQDVFTYTVSDGDKTDTAALTIDVNRAPEALTGTLSATEDGGAIVGQLTAKDLDAGETLTYGVENQPAEGSVTISPDGSYSFNPGADFQDLANGVTRDVTFDYRVTDSQGDSSVATVTVTVTGTNDTASFTSIESRSEDFNSLTAGDLGGQDGWVTEQFGSSVDMSVANIGFDSSDALQFTQVSASASASKLNTIPDLNNASTLIFEVDLAKNWRGTTIGIGADNNADGKIGRGDNELAIAIKPSDVDDQLELLLADGSTQIVAFPVADGDAWARYRVEIDLDANSGNGAVTVKYKDLVAGDNDWTTVSGLENIDAGLDTTASDHTNPDNWNGVYIWGDGAGVRVDNLTLEALSDTTTRDLTEDSEVDGSNNLMAAGQVIVTDIDTSENSFTAETQTGSYGSLVIDTAGNWTYTASNTQSAVQALDTGDQLAEAFTVTTVDGTTHAINIQINGTNDAPVISAPLSRDQDEDTGFTLTEAELLANASDIDGDTLSVTNVRIGSGSVKVADNGDGTWTVTPTPNWSGTGELLFDVSDGTVNTPTQVDLSFTPVADSVQLSVGARLQSDPVPTTTADQDFSGLSEGIQIDLASSKAQMVASGESSQIYDVTTITGTAHDDVFSFSDAQNGEVFTINGGSGNNTLDLSGFAASDVTLTNTSAVVDLGSSESFTINFTNIDDVRFDSSVSNGDPHEISFNNGDWTAEGTSLSVRGLASSDGFGFALVDYEGSLSENFSFDATVTAYESAEKYENGFIVFDYQDANNYKAVRAHIQADSWSIREVVNGTETQLATYNTALDSNVPISVSMRVTGGLVEIVDGNTVLVSHDFGSPVNTGSIGVGSEFSDTDFELNIQPTNWAPDVEDYDLTLDIEDIPIITANVLADAVDADGDPLSVTGFTQGSNGSVIDNGDGTFTYTPTNGYVGIDSFSYTVSDGQNTSTGTIKVTVTDTHNIAVTSDATGVNLDIFSALSDTDGSETLTINISGIADGAVITDGINTFTGISGNGSVDISSWQLDSIVLTTPDTYVGNFDLVVTATSTDGVDSQATSSTIHILNPNNAPELANHVLVEEVVAAFSFDDTSDVTGNGNNLTLSGSATLGAGYGGSGSALEMDGTEGHANIVGVETGGAMTVSTWVKFDSFAQSWSRVFDFGNGQANNNILIGHKTTTGTLGFHVYDGVGSPEDASLEIADFFTAGEWVHVTATIGSDGTMSVYKNGELAGQTAGVVPATMVRTNNYIGKSNWDGDSEMDGSVDEFAIYNKELSAAEIKAIYQASSVENQLNDAFFVDELSVVSTIGSVAASDDENDAITYSLTNDAGGRFSIDASTGEIAIANSALLDHETDDSHTITVQVSDGALSSTRDYTIYVTNTDEAPIASDNTLTTDEDISYTLTLADLGYSDQEGVDLSAVEITSLPTSGTLNLNGVAVTLNQQISKADIDAGYLVFVPTANEAADDYASIGFKVSDGNLWSDQSYTLTVDVNAVADRADLSVDSPTAIISEQLFNSNFSSRSLEGWSGTNYQQYTVSGNYTHRLDNSQTISRTVDTSEGTDFVLDLRVFNGFATGDSTQLEVVWDGSVVATLNPNPYSSNANQIINLSAVSGDSATLSLRAINGGSVYLDDIKLNQDLPNLIVDEDNTGAIDLALAFADQDGSETQTFMVSGLPSGAVISDGVNSVTSTGGDVDISGWNQDALSVTPAADDNSDFNLVFTASSTEATNSDAAAVQRTVVVTVNPVMDAPVSADNALLLRQGDSYTFKENDFSFSDVDSGDTLQSITVTTLPASGSLTLNGVAVTASQVISAADISNLAYTAPATEDDVSNSFTFTVSDGSLLSNSQTFDLNVRGTYSGNLLVNPGATQGTSGWTIVENSASGWGTEGDSHDGDGSSWGTSWQWNRKSQTVDLLAEGFTAEYLDSAPKIDVSDWYRQKQYGTDKYQLKIEIRDGSNNVLASYDSGEINANGSWQEAGQMFENYGAGARYIYFEHGGEDGEGWGGQYGTYIDDSNVSVALENEEDAKLTGTDNAEIIDGSSLNDTIEAKGGDDTIYGEVGADTIDAGAGNDTVIGDDADAIAVNLDAGFITQASQITLPAATGLKGEFFDTSTVFADLSEAIALTSNTAPKATFTASSFNYAQSDGTLAGFLGSDGNSLSAHGDDPDETFALKLTGYIRMSAGTHDFNVTSDDGFSLKINNQTVTEFTTPRGTATSSGNYTAPQDGLYEVELIYFQVSGGADMNITSTSLGTMEFYDSLPAGAELVDGQTYYDLPTPDITVDVADGVTLSAGTNNGDGTWTLKEADLSDLTMTSSDKSWNDSLTFNMVKDTKRTINITDSSFESVGTQVDGAFIHQPSASAWNFSGSSDGIHDYDSTAFNDQSADSTGGEDVPDGYNAAFINTDGGIISQTLSDNFDRSTTYQLQVDIGNRLNSAGMGDYEVRLTAGGVTLVSDGSLTPAEGEFETLTINLDGSTIAPDSAAVGQPITIELVKNSGYQVAFDNVRMTATTTEQITQETINTDQSDQIIGGEGDDILTGGHDSDTFIWHAGDDGTVETPAEDMITDFHIGQGGDVLDLSDVLVDEENHQLDEFLHFNFDNGDTTLEISTQANGDVTQKVTLQGVDLSSLGASDSEIINNLLNDGNLQIDN